MDHLSYNISLQNLKKESCEQLLNNAGWSLNNYQKNKFKKMVTDYSMKYPEMNLEEIKVKFHPMYIDFLENHAKWTNDYRVNNERKYRQEYRPDLFSIESFSCNLTNGEKIERNWDITKHFIGQISIWDLNDFTKRIVLHKTGWITSPYCDKRTLNFATNSYSLYSCNFNLWNFRIVKNGDVSWDIVRSYPYSL